MTAMLFKGDMMRSVTSAYDAVKLCQSIFKELSVPDIIIGQLHIEIIRLIQ